MHLPIDEDALARVVSARLAVGNNDEYIYQEDCGSSDTTSYCRLVKKSDIHHTILVGVCTSVATDGFERSLLESRFNQNAAFLTQNTGRPTAHHYHPLCPVVLAVGQPHEDFAYSWIAYKDIGGWPLASNWYQLKPEIRTIVVANLATFVRELALVPKSKAHNEDGLSVNYVGSSSAQHILFFPILAANPSYWLSASELEGVTSHAKLVRMLAENRAAMLDLHARDVGTKSLAVEQLRSIIPVAHAVLDRPENTVMAHLNLLPQNVWVDPFSGKITAVFGWEYAHWAPDWLATAPLPWLMDEKADWMLESEKMGDPWVVWRPHFHHSATSTVKEMRHLRKTWEITIRSNAGDHRCSFGNDVVVDKQKLIAMKICFVEETQLPKALGWARELLEPFAPAWTRIPWGRMLLLAVVTLGVGCCINHFGDLTTTQDSSRSLILWILAISCPLTFVSIFHPVSGLDDDRRSDAIMKFEPEWAASRLRSLDEMTFRSRFAWAFGYVTEGKIGDKALAAVPCSPANSIVPTGVYVIPNFLSRAATRLSRSSTAIGGEK